MPTLYGQSVGGYRPDRRGVDGLHSDLVTCARATPPVGADYRQSPTPRPHHSGPTAWRERTAHQLAHDGRVRLTTL
jgi:hypothetical protein